MTLLNRLTLTCGLCAALSLSAAHSVSAQDVPPTAAPEPTPEAPAPEAAVTTAAPAGDLGAEVAALRTEVEALKAKAEEAETAALLAEEPAAAAEPETLRIYGFMDFGMDKFWGGKDTGVAVVRPTTANTFVFGNLNLYIDATPVEHLRCLAEVRLTVAPHGEETQLGPPIGTSYQRTDTTAFDFSSPSSQSQLRLGGIYIERAFSEYEFSKAFRLQAGMFLNPFGIWNLDHGSPTLISLMLPTFISAQMVPTRLLGVHAYGSVFAGANTEIGYAVHVTNGRTPLDMDLSEDKALGARLFVAQEGDFGRLVIGASGYFGTYLDQQRKLDLGSTQVKIELADTVAYTEGVAGFDVALDLGSLRLRTEHVLRWVKYEDSKAEQALSQSGATVYQPNRMEYSGYVLAAYRTPWRLEPYLEVESMYGKSAILPRWAGLMAYSTPNVAVIYLSAGVNVELTTHTQFKTQLVWDRAYDRHFKNKNTDVPILFVRLVNSF